MGLKDIFNNMISYFDSEDALEEDYLESESTPKLDKGIQEEVRTPVYRDEKPVQKQLKEQKAPNYQTTQYSQQPINRERVVLNQHHSQPQTTIALKFPKKYEDAREIVDLLLNNECVLIDFQYMLDAQARRCIDFIDGASKVLSGHLRKVSGSMFLLTPPNVIVNMEEIASANQNQDFNFDMKRR